MTSAPDPTDRLPRPRPLPHIVAQHVEEAASIWALRRVAVREPHYDLRDLAALDGTLEAHLDALRIAGEEGWSQVDEAIEVGDASEVFVAAALALDRGDATRLRLAVDAVREEPERLPGLASALGWSAWEKAQGVAAGLLRESAPALVVAGLRGHALHRQHPGPALEALLRAADPVVAAAAARTAGELGRVDLLPLLEHELRAEAPARRHWAAWAAALLGSRRAPQVLAELAERGGPLVERAAATAVRTLDPGTRAAWIARLTRDPDHARTAAVAAGVAGDPAAVPWLIEAMEEPELARVAGEALVLITGVDLEDEELDGDAPPDFESGPSDDAEDDDVALDPDENLLWPDPLAAYDWWHAQQARFAPGKRHLLGRPLTREEAGAVLWAGTQRQRLAAAEELKVLDATQPLFECRAPGWRQAGRR